MAYDEQLADRVRNVLGPRRGFIEQKMFGGLCFMVRGNMCCGIVKDDLMVRVGPDQYERLLAEPYARLMDFTGRAMKGFVFVGPEGYRSDEALAKWVKRGVDFALSLPAK